MEPPTFPNSQTIAKTERMQEAHFPEECMRQKLSIPGEVLRIVSSTVTIRIIVVLHHAKQAARIVRYGIA